MKKLLEHTVSPTSSRPMTTIELFDAPEYGEDFYMVNTTSKKNNTSALYKGARYTASEWLNAITAAEQL